MSRSEVSSPTCPLMPGVLSEGSLLCFRLENGKFRELQFEDLVSKTPRELMRAPYVFRFDINEVGSAYFTEDESLFQRLFEEGKVTNWLHDLFARYQELLIQKGHSPHSSIIDHSLGHLKTLFDVYEEFPGTKEECKCKICNKNKASKVKFGGSYAS